MKKRVLKTVALCLAIVLIAGVLICANMLVGNPVSHLLARHTAEKHLEENYPGTDYEIEKVVFDFKMGTGYMVYLTSPSNIDGDFYLLVSSLGKLERDTYSSKVEGHMNAARRLMDEYAVLVDSVINTSAYPYTVYSSYGSLNFFDYEFDSPDFIKMSELENNRIYDVGELGETNGSIHLYIHSDTVTYKMAAEILLKTREMMDKAGVCFYSISLTLTIPPRDGEATSHYGNTIYVNDFLYADIYESGLEERVAKCAEKP